MDRRKLVVVAVNYSGVWIFGLLFYLCISVIATDDCPTSWATVAERCLDEDLPEYDALYDDDMLSYRYWMTTCKNYNESLNCLDLRVRNCKESGGDVTGASFIVEKMHEDFHNLCGSNETFERYNQHSECFNLVENYTTECQVNYIMETDSDYLAAAYEEEYQYVHEHNEFDSAVEDELRTKICKALKTLIDCTNKSVLDTCGADAVELYRQMLLSQIPSHVTETCNELSETSSGLASTKTSAFWIVTVILTRTLL